MRRRAAPGRDHARLADARHGRPGRSGRDPGRQPTPVIMVSALTHAGAAVTLEALDRGAVDYVAKPGGNASDMAPFAGELIEKIRTAAGMDVRRMMARRKRRPPPAHGAEPRRPRPAADDCPAEWADQCVALGISTGGPPALTRCSERCGLPCRRW